MSAVNENFDIDKLFSSTMEKDWPEVLRIYQIHPREAPIARLTKSEQTALHIAVSSSYGDQTGAENDAEVVKKLVECIPKEERYYALHQINEKGDTPLHLAAAAGSEPMCQYIGSVDKKLITERNHNGETPLFLAAHHGKKEAFMCLHFLYNGEQPPDDSLCRREDGDTVLHSALSGEYVELAYLIIIYYKRLVNSVNHEGLSPLHILASKPNVFESSSDYRLIDQFIYHWLFVPPPNNKYEPITKRKSSCGIGTCYPDNYETCMNFFSLPWRAFKVIVPLGKDICGVGIRHCIADEENPIDEGNKKTYPSIYDTGFLLFQLLVTVVLTIFGIGISRIGKIRQKKENHRWSIQILAQLINKNKVYKYDHSGQIPKQIIFGGIFLVPSMPPLDTDMMQDQPEMYAEHQTDSLGNDPKMLPTALLLAAKMGITEMIEAILKVYPMAFEELDENGKNVLLLAIENRQTGVYDLLLKMKPPEFVLYQKDNKGNGALHLAAYFTKQQPWRIPGSALQMHWEIKWYKHVKHTMPPQCLVKYNKLGESANGIFKRTHAELMKNGSEWLTKTTESCSLVAALIATVAFATASTIPGGVDQNSGRPILENHPAFMVFSITSLGALSFSVTALVFFLAVLTSRYQKKDFKHNLPMKLLIGLSSLFTSIAAMLLSFCAGHFFLIKDQLQNAAFPIYTVACLPITFFAFAQLPLYVDLWWSITRKVPLRSFKVDFH